jgi:hypothetical protein
MPDWLFFLLASLAAAAMVALALVWPVAQTPFTH